MGVLEQGDHFLREAGLAQRMDASGLPHDGIELRFGGERYRIDMKGLTGRGVMIWGQTEIVKDLIAARRAVGVPPLFDVSDVVVHGIEAYSDARVRRAWRAQHFSWWMTQLEYVGQSEAAAMMPAENYVGLPAS